VRLVLRADRRGLPLAYTLVPANEHEYEPLLDLVEAGETLIADKGLWGRAYNQRMSCAEVELLTPARQQTNANQLRERALASTRLTIESVFANLKDQMRLERHLAKTPAGLAQRLLALTLGILLNTLTGRPARALAAYDGRLTHIKPLVPGLVTGCEQICLTGACARSVPVLSVVAERQPHCSPAGCAFDVPPQSSGARSAMAWVNVH
jgi:hypothetical protein